MKWARLVKVMGRKDAHQKHVEKIKCNGLGLFPVSIGFDNNICMQYGSKRKGEALDRLV